MYMTECVFNMNSRQYTSKSVPAITAYRRLQERKLAPFKLARRRLTPFI